MQHRLTPKRFMVVHGVCGKVQLFVAHMALRRFKVTRTLAAIECTGFLREPRSVKFSC